jgi:predicted XRE-type DNA-binding protein
MGGCHDAGPVRWQRVGQPAGYQLHRVQDGPDPDDWKRMGSIEPVCGRSGCMLRRAHSSYHHSVVTKCACFSEEDAADHETRLRSGCIVVGTDNEQKGNMAAKPIQAFDNVWDSLEETPEEAASTTVQSDLMMAVRNSVESWQLTQSGAAIRLSGMQPRLNDLLRGRTTQFSLEALIGLTPRAGLTVHMEVPRTAA